MSYAGFTNMPHGHDKHMTLSVGCRIQRPGSYLLHIENDGIQHCIAVSVALVVADPHNMPCLRCTVHGGLTKWSIPLSDLKRIAAISLEYHSLCTIEVADINPVSVDQPMHSICSMRAGAKRKRDGAPPASVSLLP